MKIFKYFLSAAFLILTIVLSAQTTEIIFLSGTDASNTVEWDFYCTEGQNSEYWTKIDVPSNWELEGFGNYNYGHDWKNDEKKLGKEHGLYKYTFDIPRSWKGKTINIVFDGSMTDTEVKINGKTAGKTHQGSFYRFKYDIGKVLNYGEKNLLEVDVAKHSSNESVNRAERQADFWIFGGIFRPVFLEILPAVHIQRAAIDAKHDGSINALLEFNRLNSDCKVEVELFDLKGTKIGNTITEYVAKGSNEIRIVGNFKSVKPWSPEWPTLYDIKFTLKRGEKTLHIVQERIGFRTVELRKHDGVYINNKKVIFKGVNRHSFWPETGRCLSEENHILDIRLMKAMNMNAVRMSHYVPDKRFLELCDSMGLFVLNEVTGWQDGYDTIVGPSIIKETVLKDENHPSVVIWDHGNEGGWDFNNEKWFHYWDIQQRPVIYPWLLRNGLDTHHYPNYSYGIGRFGNGNDPFMATEFLHGLYDGGLGAGLESFWRNYESSPLHAGGFLWVLADEAVVRTDMDEPIYDSDGNHAPDGILGPHREKEGSFYTIKEIWSPVQIKPLIINKQWDGTIFLENKFLYTNLSDCSFSWKTYMSEVGEVNTKEIGAGTLAIASTLPGETTMCTIELNGALKDADIFQFKAIDPHDREIYTWQWNIKQPEEKAEEWLKSIESNETEINVEESENRLKAISSGIEVYFDKNSGELLRVINSKGEVSLSGGKPVGIKTKITDINWRITQKGQFELTIDFDNYPDKIKWMLDKNGLLYFEAGGPVNNINPVDYLGIAFNYPEEKCLSVQWMGLGPYRVWKNRMKGASPGIWEKDYNNTVTGESYDRLIYPEFKGYHGELFWAKLETNESNFTIITETPNLFFHLFTPDKPKHVTGGTYPNFPDGDLSFLYEIPAIGTKFKKPESMGPGGKQSYYTGHIGDDNNSIKLWFDFH